jgi:hypothetical protein
MVISEQPGAGALVEFDYVYTIWRIVVGTFSYEGLFCIFQRAP